MESFYKDCLYRACQQGALRTIRVLFLSGVDVNQWLREEHNWLNNNPITALSIAAEKNDLHVMEFLLQNGVDVDRSISTTRPDGTQTNRVTTLFYAIHLHNVDAVRLLLQYGANVSLVDCHGYGYMDYIRYSSSWEVKEKNRKIMSLLLQHGAKIDDTSGENLNLLFRAARHGLHEIIPLLLLHGISPNVVDNNHNTALHIACGNRHWDIAQILITKSADIFSKNKDDFTPFDVACRTECNSYYHWGDNLDKRTMPLKTMQMFLNRGGFVDKATGGWTALHVAASSAHFALTDLLLQNGASPHVKNNSGETPMDCCFPLEPKKQSSAAVIDLLIDYGACNNTPLFNLELARDRHWQNSSVTFQMKLVLNWYYYFSTVHSLESGLAGYVLAILNEALSNLIAMNKSANPEAKPFICGTVVSVIYDFVHSQYQHGGLHDAMD
jgi:ankyrin repeat protein